MLLDREVAVKILHLNGGRKHAIDDGQNEELVDRFFKEAKLAAKLNHPNILSIHDVGRESDEVCFLVSELLEGQSLEARLAQGPLSLSETLEMMGQVASALLEAHQRQIIHRDIKPANIYLQEIRGGARAKLLDFGIAKALFETSYTLTEQTMGTPYYMSPEQIKSTK